MALTSLQQVKTFLGVTTTTEDLFLSQVQTAAEEALKRMVGWRIEQTTYTEYYNGNNQAVILLRETPIDSIVSVHEDPQGYHGEGTNAFSSETLLEEGIHYYLEKDGPNSEYSKTGRLVRIGSVWFDRFVRRPGFLSLSQQPRQGNIKVVYVGGFRVIPADIQLAVWQIVGQIRSRREFGNPLNSESFEGYSYSTHFADKEWMQIGTVAQVVEHYKRIRIA